MTEVTRHFDVVTIVNLLVAIATMQYVCRR